MDCNTEPQFLQIFFGFYWFLEFKCYSNLRASVQIKDQVVNSYISHASKGGMVEDS